MEVYPPSHWLTACPCHGLITYYQIGYVQISRGKEYNDIKVKYRKFIDECHLPFLAICQYDPWKLHRPASGQAEVRALKGGGVPMSNVEFKKCQCPQSLKWPCPMSPLKMLSCRLSNLRNTPCCVPFFPHVTIGCLLHVDF